MRKNKLPEILKKEGYPTDEFLKFIENYQSSDYPILELIRIICDTWEHGSMGYKIYRRYKRVVKLELHTLGWSGNEDIITSILKNIYLTHSSMLYYKWIVGGHYYFKIDLNKK